MADFTQILLRLDSNSSLNDKQKSIMRLVIDYLLNQMSMGNSCIDIQDFCKTSEQAEGTSKSLINILKKSGICGIHTLHEQYIEPLPLTLFMINKTNLLYITRYLYYEVSILRKLRSLTYNKCVNTEIVINNLMSIKNQVQNDYPNNEQLSAIQISALNQLSFITGGPGTGKTTTVLILLIILIRIYKNIVNDPKICIVAPTGKAAIRVKESVCSNLIRVTDQFGLSPYESEVINNVSYSTIHKLLGYKYGSIYFKHDNNNPLDVDILIIDESSMISLPLFYKLLLAIDHQKIKNIIFLGDKNQLSSVEEGYVFAMLVEKNKSVVSDLFTSVFNISELISSNRNLGEIAQFAGFILNNDIDQIIKIIRNDSAIKARNNSNFKKIIIDLFDNDSPLVNYIRIIEEIVNLTSTIDDIEVSKLLFKEFKNFAILCAVNNGVLGVNNLNKQIETVIKNKFVINREWYTGRPILVLENNSALGIYNGDVGICVIVNGKPIIIFEDGKKFSPEIIPKHQLAYAMTIHKSQGSEYNHVYIILPNIVDQNKTVLTRELLYTAITRAKADIVLYTQFETIIFMIKNKTKRITGIAYL
ncbi:MAG: exodeoxyribonuclease V subunit alpha [Neisseriaceae bacterium]